MLKNKRVILVACAIVFLCIVFFSKTGININKKNETIKTLETGLTYDSGETIQNLVNKDTDGDGIFDWEEGLWGTDPSKKETTPGISDRIIIKKLKAAQELSNPTNEENGTNQNSEKINQTDQFSRDLFTTIAAATQNGQQLDQDTIDKISSSLADNIKNSPQRKVYKLSDLKIIKDDSTKAVKNYNNTMGLVYKGSPGDDATIKILNEFATNPDNPNTEALKKLDPIIKKMNTIITAMVKINVSLELAQLHLDVINNLEKVVENLSDIGFYDTDVLVALRGASQYNSNNTALETATFKLKEMIWQRLKS